MQDCSRHLLAARLPNDVGVGVDDAEHVADLLLTELQLAHVPDEVHHAAEDLVLLVCRLAVVHQDVEHLPRLGLVLLQPQHPQRHDGVIPLVRLAEVCDREPVQRKYLDVCHVSGLSLLWTRVSQHGALPRVRPVLLLAVRAAEGPPAVATPVHQTCTRVTCHVSAQSRVYTCTWQPLVARQADGPGVVVCAHGGGRVLEDDLPGLDVPGGDELPPAALLVVDGVVHGDPSVGNVMCVLCFDCGQLSPVQTNTDTGPCSARLQEERGKPPPGPGLTLLLVLFLTLESLLLYLRYHA